MNSMNPPKDWEKIKRESAPKKDNNPKPKKKKLPDWSISLIVYGIYIIIGMIMIITMWFSARWLHYKFGYEHKVQKAIIEMVKPEALKEKYRK